METLVSQKQECANQMEPVSSDRHQVDWKFARGRPTHTESTYCSTLIRQGCPISGIHRDATVLHCNTLLHLSKKMEGNACSPEYHPPLCRPSAAAPCHARTHDNSQPPVLIPLLPAYSSPSSQLAGTTSPHRHPAIIRHHQLVGVG